MQLFRTREHASYIFFIVGHVINTTNMYHYCDVMTIILCIYTVTGVNFLFCETYFFL